MLLFWEYSICISLIMYKLNQFMLITIAVILLVLWILGVVGVYTIGWFVHVLLVAAVVLFLVRVIQGRNPLK